MLIGEQEINLEGKLIKKSEDIESDSESEEDLKRRERELEEETVRWIKKESLADNFKGEMKGLLQLFREMGIDQSTPK